jgi:hypothetical protein
VNEFLIESLFADVPPLQVTLGNWRDTPDGREVCDATLTDGAESVVMTRYSPSPISRGQDDWVDDMVTFIEAVTDDPDQRRAHELWAGKYESPID